VSFSLSEKGLQKIDAVILRYPQKNAALLPVLQIIQREQGLVSPEAVDWTSAKLGLSRVQINEVLSFYTLLRRKAAGRYVIQVCRNISCYLNGGEDLLKHLEAKLGVRAGETTPDGKFTLLVAECLGNCDHAPCLMINDDDFGPVTPDLIDGVLKELV
jgi:NADH-quinone oxidoreductase subunit E